MRLKRIQFSIVLIVLVTVALVVSCSSLIQTGPAAPAVAVHPEADFTRSCVECHSEATPEITAQWAASGHGKLNYGCYICHGDGEAEFTVTPATDNCVACHSSSAEHLEDVAGTGCFECHNGHSLIAE